MERMESDHMTFWYPKYKDKIVGPEMTISIGRTQRIAKVPAIAAMHSPHSPHSLHSVFDFDQEVCRWLTFEKQRNLIFV